MRRILVVLLMAASACAAMVAFGASYEVVTYGPQFSGATSPQPYLCRKATNINDGAVGPATGDTSAVFTDPMFVQGARYFEWLVRSNGQDARICTLTAVQFSNNDTVWEAMNATDNFAVALDSVVGKNLNNVGGKPYVIQARIGSNAAAPAAFFPWRYARLILIQPMSTNVANDSIFVSGRVIRY